MTRKTQGHRRDAPADETAFGSMAWTQNTGMQSLSMLGAAWGEAISEVGEELTEFVANRLREDLKFQHRLMHCKDLADIQSAQTDFVHRAIADYTSETGRLAGLAGLVEPQLPGKKSH